MNNDPDPIIQAFVILAVFVTIPSVCWFAFFLPAALRDEHEDPDDRRHVRLRDRKPGHP